MESAFILAVAVSGFLFVNLNLSSRYKFKRAQDWSAYLYVVAWGLPFFLISWGVISLLSHFGILKLLYEDYLKDTLKLSSIVTPVVGLDEKKAILKSSLIVISSLLLSYITGFIITQYYKHCPVQKLKRLALIVEYNALESLLLEAHIKNSPILLTLSSSKVYVGFVTRLPKLEDGEQRYLSLLPLFSGYRKQDTNQIKFLTNYYAHYEYLLNEEESERNPSDFKITFPVNEIISISFFDMESFNHFAENQTKPNQYFRRSTHPH